MMRSNIAQLVVFSVWMKKKVIRTIQFKPRGIKQQPKAVTVREFNYIFCILILKIYFDYCLADTLHVKANKRHLRHIIQNKDNKLKTEENKIKIK